MSLSPTLESHSFSVEAVRMEVVTLGRAECAWIVLRGCVFVLMDLKVGQDDNF